MKHYTDKDGTVVVVSDDHIQTAIRLKIELQNASPSGKCNWNLHKQMMVDEGYHNSSTSERYRVFIKHYQQKLGLLPSQSKYADFVTEKKLDSIRQMVGAMSIERRGIQNANRELNKTKRAIADEMIVIDEITSQISDLRILSVEPNEITRQNQNRVAIVTPSDWHIGLLYKDLNFQTAKNRVLEYANKIIEYCILFEIDTLYVANLGDVVNNVYMHKNTQAYNSEFTVSEQIVKATELMFEFLNILSVYTNVVYLGTVSGNHGRMSTKGETLTSDSVEVVVDSMIRAMIDKSSEMNVNLSHDKRGYNKDYITYKIFDKEFLFVHGDKENRDGSTVIKKYSSVLNKQIDFVVKGHTHSFKVETENHGRKIITSGCLMGSDDYAESLGYMTEPSQLMLVLEKDSLVPIEINFKD